MSRWDTCGPQAVLEAHHGALLQLAPLVKSNELRRYKCDGALSLSLVVFSSVLSAAIFVCCRYLPNHDRDVEFEPGEVLLTKYNARSSDMADGRRRAMLRDELQPWSNVQGLFALSPSESNRVQQYGAVMRQIAAKYRPAYD